QSLLLFVRSSPMRIGPGLSSFCLGFLTFVVGAAHASDDDWPSYNRTLTSERFVPRLDINVQNVHALREICTFDTGIETSFQTGPIVIDGVLYGTTEMDTFAIDASNCKQKWRVHEGVKPTMLQVNRGAAFSDGRLVRGLQDGRVVAYDAQDGR